MIEPVAIGPDELLRKVREVERLWLEVWPGTSRSRFDEILPRHASREGFRSVVAYDEAGSLVGLAYGYAGKPGEWWHDIISAEMGPELAARWLGLGHFELVELMVAPSRRGHGLGNRLHDAVLDGATETTAVLTTQVENIPALRLYQQRGWRTILPQIRFPPGDAAYAVLGLDVRGEAA